MFDPLIPPSTRASRSRRPRLLQPTLERWDSELTYPPSLEPMHLNDYFPQPKPFVPEKAPSDLPARVAALNRRAANVSKNLEHLTAVVKPLESVKAGNLSQSHLHEMHQEGVGLIEALHAFEEQTLEVLQILGDLLKSRRVAEVEWEEDWDTWGWTEGGGRVRRRMGRKV